MLIRAATITDPASPHHGRIRDVRIEGGHITKIGERIEPAHDEPLVEYAAARLAPGFVDIGAYLGDPGHEEREDIQSLIAAAAAGGYVAVAVLPNTDPVRQTVADVRYLDPYRSTGAVDLLPLAALSRDAAGRDLTEMMELAAAGALAFTDGPGKPASSSLLTRGLQYAKGFRGTIIDTPHDPEIAGEGQMHESQTSVRLGLTGIPTIAETVALRRTLELIEYTEGKLIVHLLSSAQGLAILAAYQQDWETTRINCTVSAHHLSFTDEHLGDFDPNYKLLPPLRSAADRDALRQAVLSGQIEAIVTNHRARHGEEKDLEFSYAAFGALGLETCLRQLLTWAEEGEALDCIITALTAGPRKLLGLPSLTIEVGQPAALALFTTGGSSVFTQADLKGKTKNSPLLGQELPGRILATINNGRVWTSA